MEKASSGYVCYWWTYLLTCMNHIHSKCINSISPAISKTETLQHHIKWNFVLWPPVGEEMKYELSFGINCKHHTMASYHYISPTSTKQHHAQKCRHSVKKCLSSKIRIFTLSQHNILYMAYHNDYILLLFTEMHTLHSPNVISVYSRDENLSLVVIDK